MKTYYIPKYTQVKGCQIIQSEYAYAGSIKHGYTYLKIGRDVFLTASEAITRSEAQCQARIASLRKTIAKLEALTYGGAK